VRIAILDLGTNTFHLLIADVEETKSKIIFRSKIAVKLGEGAIHNNWIAPRPFRRGLNTLLHYREIIKKHTPDKIVAYATSAIRSAENGKNFVKAVKDEAGLNIRIISGEEEAELIYFGVRQCIRLEEPSLIMDIGGGSTEFIIADDTRIFWKNSFNIGAARLLAHFSPSDPIRKSEIRKIENYFEENLSILKQAIKKYPVRKLIGSSGSFDTFAEMAGHRFHGKNIIRSVSSYKFDMKEFKKLSKVIIKSSLEERLNMKGLIKMRVDMIVLAALFTNHVLDSMSIREMHLSKYALKEGVLWKEFN
jgi:exopolyphosphatase/guanosine-5'-triphosphate,3'-diphosphate pyrophosphatase